MKSFSEDKSESLYAVIHKESSVPVYLTHDYAKAVGAAAELAHVLPEAVVYLTNSSKTDYRLVELPLDSIFNMFLIGAY